MRTIHSQAYMEFTSQQAATATKRYIDGIQSGEAGSNQQRRPNVSFHNSHVNPFKTLPKDAPQRQNRDVQGRGAPAGPNFNNNNNGPPVGNFQGNNNSSGGFQGNFRGGRGGYNRGGMRGGYNNNYGNSNMNAFNNNMGFNPMGGGGAGFNRGAMGAMGGNFNNRGGPTMRGRGNMNMMGNPMMGNPMGMGGMMPNMNMMGGGLNGMGEFQLFPLLTDTILFSFLSRPPWLAYITSRPLPYPLALGLRLD